jgi:hypothetical protein
VAVIQEVRNHAELGCSVPASDLLGGPPEARAQAGIMRNASFRGSAFFRPCPHFAHKCGSEHLSEGGRNRVQIVVEQVGVGVERLLRGGVPEHPLQRFDVRPAGDVEARAGVPQLVAAREAPQNRAFSRRSGTGNFRVARARLRRIRSCLSSPTPDIGSWTASANRRCRPTRTGSDSRCSRRSRTSGSATPARSSAYHRHPGLSHPTRDPGVRTAATASRIPRLVAAAPRRDTMRSSWTTPGTTR